MGYLFTHFIVSLLYKCLDFMRCHLPIIGLWKSYSGSAYLCMHVSWRVLLKFSSLCFRSSDNILRSMIYLELSFQQNEREGSTFNFFVLKSNFSGIFVKMLSFLCGILFCCLLFCFAFRLQWQTWGSSFWIDLHLGPQLYPIDLCVCLVLAPHSFITIALDNNLKSNMIIDAAILFLTKFAFVI